MSKCWKSEAPRYYSPKLPLLNLQTPPGVVITNPLCGSYVTRVSSLKMRSLRDKIVGCPPWSSQTRLYPGNTQTNLSFGFCRIRQGRSQLLPTIYPLEARHSWKPEQTIGRWLQSKEYLPDGAESYALDNKLKVSPATCRTSFRPSIVLSTIPLVCTVLVLYLPMYVVGM